MKRWITHTIFSVAITGTAFWAVLVCVSSPTRVITVTVVLALVALAYSRPRAALGVWLAVTIFIPYWIGPTAPIYLAPAAAVGLPILAGYALRFRGVIDVVPDGLLFLFVLLSGLAVFADTGSPINVLKDFVLLWGGGYYLGKFSVKMGFSKFAESAFLNAMMIVAAWAVVESAIGWHPFAHLVGPNEGLRFWAEIQQRAGGARSETSFGHSLALGGALALAVPYATRLRRPLAALALLGAGVVVTLARGPLIAFGLVLVLVALQSRGARGGRAPRLALGLLVFVSLTTLSSVFEAAGAENTASYRGTLVQAAIHYARFFGLTAQGVYNAQSNQLIIQGLPYLDNGYVQIALLFGWLVIFVLLIPIGFLIRRVLTRHGSVHEIALAGQLPLLGVTALITQWQSLFWFVAGMAAAAAADSSRATREGSDLILSRGSQPRPRITNGSQL